MERGWKPNVDIYPPCPRCGSSNTKFCYYNNYSLTQPRYFCKGCRRYWTKGGSLRSVPVGGGCRKSRRSKSSIRMLATSSRNSPYGGNSIDATSTSSIPNATNNIDLAQVYANFLNQGTHDQPSQDHQIPQLPIGVDQNGSSMDMDFATRPFHGNGIIFEYEPFLDRSSETYLSEGTDYHFCGFDSSVHEGILSESTNQLISYNGLPPLPGEELTWSSSLGFQEEGQFPKFDLQNNGTFFKP